MTRCATGPAAAMIAALEDAAAKAARDGPSAIRFHGEDVRT